MEPDIKDNKDIKLSCRNVWKAYGSQPEKFFNFGNGLVLTTWSGFYLEDGRVLTISRDGEIIDIHPPAEGFGEADRVELKLRFDRLGLASPTPCGEKNPF